MAETKKYLGFDIGASGGRAFLGQFDGENLVTELVHRFHNAPVCARGGLYWDVLAIIGHMKTAMRMCRGSHGGRLDGVGIDTWGGDFGLLDEKGYLLGNPTHYRDRKNAGAAAGVSDLLGGYEIYRATGMRISDINTISQLYALRESSCPRLKIARHLLMMPVLLGYLLGGGMVHERSIITPTGLFNIRTGLPEADFLAGIGLPCGMIGGAVQAGSFTGEYLAGEEGLPEAPIIAPAMHDTASAVIAVPADNRRQWAFISSGTWCMAGVERDEPLISRAAYETGIMNAAVSEGRYMAFSGIAGFWLVQESIRVWESAGGAVDYTGLLEQAERAEPFSALIDVDDERFAGFSDIPRNIADYCRQTGQRVPPDRGAVMRIILESIAMKQRLVLERLQQLSGKKIGVLHLMGGGAKNPLFCRLTCSAAGVPVKAGPEEGAVFGNIIMQMAASGDIGSVEEGRSIIRRASPPEEYEPEDRSLWEEAYRGYLKITGVCRGGDEPPG